VLSEVPVDDRELPLLFHARTVDFQDITVQATLTFRLADPPLAAARIDFSIDSGTGRWRSTPLEQVAGILTESAQQYALDLVTTTTLTAALTAGVAPVRDVIVAGLARDTRLAETGIAVIGVRVVAIRPGPEMEKALRTPTREHVQESDRATYERRALAVERERSISENELQNQIELARREEQLVTQRGVNARRTAEEAASAGQVTTEAEARRSERLAAAQGEGIRVVVVHRRTERDELIARHGTTGQVAFFLSVRGRNLDEVEQRHRSQQVALGMVSAAVPVDWRRGRVERADLSRFVFAPDDVIVVVGQDGLVANVAKYLSRQPVIGINPEPDRNPGVLVRHDPGQLADLLSLALDATNVEERTMVEAVADDGQTLTALNEIYVGHASHQTARYRIALSDRPTERQASSGLIVATGTGATGWCRSAWRARRPRAPGDRGVRPARGVRRRHRGRQPAARLRPDGRGRARQSGRATRALATGVATSWANSPGPARDLHISSTQLDPRCS